IAKWYKITWFIMILLNSSVWILFSALHRFAVRAISRCSLEGTVAASFCGLGHAFFQVHGDWLVYSNKLLVSPAVLVTSTGSVIVRGQTIVIPVECHYKRKQTVKGEPLAPTWVPMTSTLNAFGLLRFSLSVMTESCMSERSSSEYQQGEAVFLEASVEAPLHPSLRLYVDSCVATLKPDLLSWPRYKFISNHGCMMDSVLPGSSSRYLPRKQISKLCFSFKTFRFNLTSVFISCHLTATVKQKSPSLHSKACFFDSTFQTQIQSDYTDCSKNFLSKGTQLIASSLDKQHSLLEKRRATARVVCVVHVFAAIPHTEQA
uniref:Zona pellucida sperm-binding protein 3 n=1 Tax=Fundulus heteroclitus TaxID=8078 RepID=A0A3Q2PG98_FUNHE